MNLEASVGLYYVMLLVLLLEVKDTENGLSNSYAYSEALTTPCYVFGQEGSH